MTKVDENIKTAQDMLNWIVERCYDLERENKKLKERIKELEYLWDINEELKEENKKLKEGNERLRYTLDNMSFDFFRVK